MYLFHDSISLEHWINEFLPSAVGGQRSILLAETFFSIVLSINSFPFISLDV